MPGAIGTLWNNIVAYVTGTNLLRVGETNHLSAQYVSELMVSNAALVLAGSPYTYPSVAGGAMAGFKDISFMWYILGNAGGAGTSIAMTIEMTDDDVTPRWIDVTRAGYLRNNPAAGWLPSYQSVAAAANMGILDFDNANSKLYRVVLTITGVAAQNCTGIVYSRRKAL